MQLIGTKIINKASTEEKILTIARKKAELGHFLNDVFKTEIEFPEKFLNSLDKKTPSLDNYTKNVIVTLFSPELEAVNNPNSQLSSDLSEEEAQQAAEETERLEQIKQELEKILVPTSSNLGATLGNLSNVLREQLGAPFAVKNSLAAIIDNVNPNFTNKIDATIKKLKAEELANSPGPLAYSIRNMLALTEKTLEIPFVLAADLYTGTQSIMQQICDIKDQISVEIFNFYWGLEGTLNPIYPFTNLSSLLKTMYDLVSQIPTIVNEVGKFSKVEKLREELISSLSEASVTLNKPEELAKKYKYPPTEEEFISLSKNGKETRDFKALREMLIPKSILQQMDQLENIPSLGYASNAGYSLMKEYEKLSQDVTEKTFEKYREQAAFVAPLLNKQTNTRPVHDSQKNTPATIEPAVTNKKIASVQEVPVQLAPRKSIFKQKQPENREEESSSSESSPNPSNWLQDIGNNISEFFGN